MLRNFIRIEDIIISKQHYFNSLFWYTQRLSSCHWDERLQVKTLCILDCCSNTQLRPPVDITNVVETQVETKVSLHVIQLFVWTCTPFFPLPLCNFRPLSPYTHGTDP